MSKEPDRLPFEPVRKGKKKKLGEKPASTPTPLEASRTPSSMPQEVNDRIVRRAAIFCGIPTFMGMLTFVASYLVVSQQWLELPNVLVVFVSMAFFGLGVLGLSYGAISASWEEGRTGGWWGWQEFTKNLGYLSEAWKSQRSQQ